MSDAMTPVVQTSAGPVRGTVDGGVSRFASIPFAAAPIGPNRFRAPKPVAPWTEELDATAFGPTAMQNASMMDLLNGGEPEERSEDCLRLNVWSPDLGGSAPVMVWIHGGGFEIGSGSSPLYDGVTFAESGVVFVSINYRLGAFGFLELGGLDASYAGSGNNGLLDQVAALEWVRDEIASFGGDPAQVTIFGESAGSMSVALLLAVPAARGLFHAAICESGGANGARSVELANADCVEFLATAELTTIDEVLVAPAEQFLIAHGAISVGRITDLEATIKRTGSPLSFLVFRPVADGATVPTDPLAAIAGGSSTGIPLLVGTNSEEWKLFALMSPAPTDEAGLLERLEMLPNDSQATLDIYADVHPDATPGDIECAVITDLVFRVPASDLADAHSAHGPTWQYLFDWRSPSMGGMLGAAHAMEIPFVFDHAANPAMALLVGDAPPAALGRHMHDAWAAFAEHGSPSTAALPDWPQVTAEQRPVMVFDVDQHLDMDPADKTRRFWSTS